MKKPRSKKALYIGLPLALAVAAGAGFLAWDHWFKGNAGYPLEVIQQANEMQDRLLSFDSHITVPLDFGGVGNEADKDGSGRDESDQALLPT